MSSQFGPVLTVSTYYYWFNQRLQSQCGPANTVPSPPGLCRDEGNGQPSACEDQQSSECPRWPWTGPTHGEEGTEQARGPHFKAPLTPPDKQAEQGAPSPLTVSVPRQSHGEQGGVRQGHASASPGLLGTVRSHPGPQPSTHAHPGLGHVGLAGHGVSAFSLLFPPWWPLGPAPTPPLCASTRSPAIYLPGGEGRRRMEGGWVWSRTLGY